MFNVGGSEILVILVMALLVLGPERLPGAARQIGRALAELRRVRSGVERDFREAMGAEDFQEASNAIREVASIGSQVKSEFASITSSIVAPIASAPVVSAPVAGGPMQAQRETKTALASPASGTIPPPDGIFADERERVDLGGVQIPTPRADTDDILVDATYRSEH